MILFIILLIIIGLFVIYQQQYIQSKNISELQEFQNILSKTECQKIIELAKKSNMVESSVVDSTGLYSSNTNFRKSKQVWLDPLSDPVLQKISDLSIALTGFPRSNQEMIQVVQYQPGGKFDAHYDACVQNDKICQQMNRGSTERRTTLLFYLNDDMEGGETEFVNINRKIKPETGKAILFWSTDNHDKLYENSKHRGNPVIKGEKWIATVWSHGSIFQ